MTTEDALRGIARAYPEPMIAEQVRDIPRIAFNLSLALDAADPRGLSICDIGGVGLFEGTRIVGRNWLGHSSASAVVRLGTRLADVPLRLFPSLCSDIYLTGHTPPTLQQS